MSAVAHHYLRIAPRSPGAEPTEKVPEVEIWFEGAPLLELVEPSGREFSAWFEGVPLLGL